MADLYTVYLSHTCTDSTDAFLKATDLCNTVIQLEHCPFIINTSLKVIFERHVHIKNILTDFATVME